MIPIRQQVPYVCTSAIDNRATTVLRTQHAAICTSRPGQMGSLHLCSNTCWGVADVGSGLFETNNG